MVPRLGSALAVLSALAAASGATSAAAQADHPAVEAFGAYQRAAAGRDGDSASRRVTQRTVDFYARCRRAALTMPEARLRRQSPLMRITTLSMRIDYTAAQLRPLNGRQVLAGAIDRGQVGPGIEDFVVGDVHPGPRVTRIDVRREGGGHAGTVIMRREGGAWRLDLLEVIQQVDQQLEAMARRFPDSGEDAAIMLTLAMMHRGQSLDDEPIWVPLERR